MKILPLPFLLQKLCGILSTIADDAEVSIFYSDNHVIIKSGRTKFDLQTIDAEQYPIMKEQMEFQYSLRYAMHEV